MTAGSVAGTAPGAAAVAAYDPGSIFDEAFEETGEPRAHYVATLAALAEHDLGALRAAVLADLETVGCGFATESGSDAFRVDPVPRILPAGDFAQLAAGLEQRVSALNAFVADVYGEQRIVEAGVVPARVIESADHYEPAVAEHHRPLQIAFAGLDVIRAPDGRFAVLEDNVRTPSGLAYLLAARRALLRRLGAPDELLGVHDTVIAMVSGALRAAARGRDDLAREPEVVLLSDGPRNAAWWEHGELARLLGVPLVAPEDCEHDGDRLLRRDEHARRVAVDVVYRRTDEDRLAGEDGELTGIGSLLDGPLRAGTLACVNAFGTGVADDKLVHAYVEDMITFYLDEAPALPSIRTYDLGDDTCRAEALERLDELVVKPRAGYGGTGVVIGPHAHAADLEDLARRVRSAPTEFVAQETVHFSRHPTVIDGRLEPRHVDLRPFVAFDGRRARTVPGGLTRVAFGEGDLVVNSSQDGGAKDTWVLR
jgi:uncharacterized circularly permuted ATP-grasp superfamily protein